jgi:hypothetical protein
MEEEDPGLGEEEKEDVEPFDTRWAQQISLARKRRRL